MPPMPKGQLSPDRPVGTEHDASSRPDELTIGASGAEVRRATDWLDSACKRRKIPDKVAERLALCLHEVLVNIISHGGQSALAAPIALTLDVRSNPGKVEAGVTVSDAGVAFSPLTVP